MNSTLAVAKAEYESECGEYLGVGRTAAEWDAKAAIWVPQAVKEGLRAFYWPGHTWSFLKPQAQVVFLEGDHTVQLPDDFCGVDGGIQINVVDANGYLVSQKRFCGVGKVQAAIDATASTLTGRPELIALRPRKQMAPGKMQSFEMIIYPEADQEYTLKFPYYITPDYLTDVTPYVYGGVEHHNTIMECCLAAAELKRDGMIGPHNAEKQRLLGISISNDRLKQPKKLGYNGDNSDGCEDGNETYRNIATGVTYEGTFYS